MVSLTIEDISEVKLQIESVREMVLEVESPIIVLELDLSNAIPPNSYDVYKGDYVVIPQRERGTTLDTNEKLLTDNVTVKEIPYSVTSNASGGNTCYIGKEVF